MAAHRFGVAHVFINQTLLVLTPNDFRAVVRACKGLFGDVCTVVQVVR